MKPAPKDLNPKWLKDNAPEAINVNLLGGALANFAKVKQLLEEKGELKDYNKSAEILKKAMLAEQQKAKQAKNKEADTFLADMVACIEKDKKEAEAKAKQMQQGAAKGKG